MNFISSLLLLFFLQLIYIAEGLNIRDLGDVIRKLEDAQFNKPDWEKLGRELGLHQNTLNMINANERGDTEKCFTECLSKWLNRADDVDSKSGKPTFSSLADALDHMGKKNDADHIRRLSKGKSKRQKLDPTSTRKCGGGYKYNDGEAEACEADEDTDGPAQGKKSYDSVFRVMLPRLTAALGKEPSFTIVTDFLLADDLITEQQLASTKSKSNLSDQQRGSEVAHYLLDKIKNHDDPAKCLLKICDIFEDEDVGSDVLKKHGATMRSKIKVTSGTTTSHPIKEQPAPVSSGINNAASSRFRSVSDRLENAISSCLTGVVGKLYAPGLISLELKDEMINSHDIPSKKASKLVSELQRTLNSHENPETFLNDVCTVLRDVGEKPITDIVNKLGPNAISHAPPQLSAGHPVLSHPEEYSKQKFDITNELSITDLDVVRSVLSQVMFGSVHWTDLGLSLGLYMPTLNVIGRTNGDSDDYLKLTLQKWLQKKDKVTRTTWNDLIRAVRSTGDNAAAERIPGILRSRHINY